MVLILFVLDNHIIGLVYLGGGYIFYSLELSGICNRLDRFLYMGSLVVGLGHGLDLVLFLFGIFGLGLYLPGLHSNLSEIFYLGFDLLYFLIIGLNLP
nr:MAG TPA: hypothetical protein [Caudoviricetes sp.]